MRTYEEFLRSKMELAPKSGFEIDLSEINPVLKPHQRDAVQWAVRGGRRALFERFGLGKTVQELEWCRIVTEHQGRRFLKHIKAINYRSIRSDTDAVTR